LGINVTKKTTINLFHAGRGAGFGSYMLWAPEYGIGALVMINEDDLVANWNVHNELVVSILRGLIYDKLVEKVDSFDETSWQIGPADQDEHSAYQPPDPDTFTPYQSDWKFYTGTYRYLMSGWKFRTYARVGLALGYSVPELQVKVYEKNGFLEINGERLDEHLPGLFFTKDGACLDLRAPLPTWKNYRMKKIE
jgi:hypothetical protein